MPFEFKIFESELLVVIPQQSFGTRKKRF